MQTVLIQKETELFPHGCYMWLYTWRLKTSICLQCTFSFITFLYNQFFYLMQKKENPEVLFTKKGQSEQITIVV